MPYYFTYDIHSSSQSYMISIVSTATKSTHPKSYHSMVPSISPIIYLSCTQYARPGSATTTSPSYTPCLPIYHSHSIKYSDLNSHILGLSIMIPHDQSSNPTDIPTLCTAFHVLDNLNTLYTTLYGFDCRGFPQ